MSTSAPKTRRKPALPRDPELVAFCENIGVNIRRYRKLRGLTARQLAAAANVHYVTLSKAERGKFTISTVLLDSLATALGVDSAVLLATAQKPK